MKKNITTALAIIFFSVLSVAFSGIPQVHADPNSTTLTNGSFSTGVSCTASDTTTCYGLFSGFSSALDTLGGKFDQISDADTLGGFVNGIIAFGIGIGGILAVAMIMYEGFLYMRTDNTSTKGEMRSRIVSTAVGFLLLLCIFTLLRTINPDLLNLNPGINFAALDPNESGDGVTDEKTTATDQNVATPTTATEACEAGVTKVQGIIICKDLATGLGNMLAAAKTAGITLGGGGYRSPQQQVALRTQNCGGSDNYSVYQKPSLSCKPPTAIPGTSRHESGLAVDFSCNGIGMINIVTRPTTAVCFNWMKANAATYGFYNLPQENWHWSVDGR